MEWLNALTDLVDRKPLVIFRFSREEWERLSLRNSSQGINQFTVVRSRWLLDKVRVPTACLLIGEEINEETEAYFGLAISRTQASTLDSRIKFASAQQVFPSAENDLLHLVTKTKYKSNLRTRLESDNPVIPLSPKLSVHLVEKLSARVENHEGMRTVVDLLDILPKTYSGNRALQQDAINLALTTFGLSSTASAIHVETADDRETALTHVNAFEDDFVRIYEDAVLEHDARNVPGFSYVESDLTGRAIFQRNSELLEVITANRRPLEKVFGVDLIYLNAIKQNIVMVQYKMLEYNRKGPTTDWIYRPDRQLEKEMNRMRLFGQSHSPGPLEYRINPQVFYLRFVRRDAALGKSTVTMPIDHFEILRDDPSCRGPKGAFRISYDTLDGKYLRQTGFLDLVRSGYIGAHAKTTADLKSLIMQILKGNCSLVGAVHTQL